MKAIELFAGAGGLGMGVSLAGFKHVGVVEWNPDACDTIRANRERGVKPVVDWPEIYQGDVRLFDFGSVGSVDLVSGGPPCQPFSLGGKHGAHRDDRDMWPEAARAVRKLAPRAFMFENVRGLTRPSFAEYFEHVVLRLTYPEIEALPDEDWIKHRVRLKQHEDRGKTDGLHYHVEVSLVDACDFGVAQHRQRVFIVGFRSDIDVEWSFPLPTHSREALLWSKWVTGDYWERHGVSARARPKLASKERAGVERMRGLFSPAAKPWATVRDALVGLPEPSASHDAEGVLNHRLQLGARPYAGHTGSALDEPAKTLKAGDHGVPGGENMLLNPDGSVRYFTVRECARLQTFPDDYFFRGAWGECMRQLGNAVPIKLGRVVAESIQEALTHEADTKCPKGPRVYQGAQTQGRDRRSRSRSTSDCSE